jgi:hypothetical protein
MVGEPPTTASHGARPGQLDLSDGSGELDLTGEPVHVLAGQLGDQKVVHDYVPLLET